MASSRRSRSDAGVLALTKALMKDVFGLNDDTISKVVKVIRNSGQLQDLKVSMRSINSVAYKRLNQVIDTIEEDKKKKDEPADRNEASDKKDSAKKKEQVAESFLGYLLNELQIDAERLRTDPETKQDVMRLARASDSQAQAMTQRMQRDKMRRDREAIQKADNPQKAQLLRKKMALQRQIEKLDDQIANMGNQQ